jgi:hypothetical protein
MKITPAHVLMPILCLGVGIALIYVGLYRGWGSVWAVVGGFFITVGLGAGVLTLAWVLPGPGGAILRRPIVSIVILGAVVAMMALTVYVGIVSRGR